MVFKKNIRFVLIFLFWLLGIVAILILLLFPHQERYHLLYQTGKIADSGKHYLQVVFTFADSWNYILITFLVCISLLLICVNDILIKKWLWRRFEKSKSFYTSDLFLILKSLTNLCLFFLQIILFCYVINVATSSDLIIDAKELDGKNFVVLLLGTSKFLGDGRSLNRYYAERLSTTLELYKSGKARKIIVSGDHQGVHYSEPIMMRRDLINFGVPERIIEMDFNGYSTFDSILRIEGVKSQPIIIVSQRFHLERALYLCNRKNIRAIGVEAKGVMNVKMVKRELLAKTKVLLDIYIFNTQAYNLPAHPRREISMESPLDVVLLIFVLACVGLAGRMARHLMIN